MSVRAITWAWEQQIPPNGKILLVALADHAHDDGRNSYPSVATLCHKTGLSRSTVQRLLTSLVNEGVICVQRAGGTDGRTPTVYALMIEESFAVSKQEFNRSFCPPALRASTITHDNLTCQLECGKVGTESEDPDGNPWEIDRIEAGGRYVEGNVRLACRSCNRKRWRHREGPHADAPTESGGLMEGEGGASSVRPEPRTNPTTPTTTSTSPQSTPSVREEVRGKMTKSWKPTIEASNEALSRFDSLPLSRVASEAQTFRDWHIAQDTPSKTRSQWDALWLTWLDRKNVEEAKESPPDEVKRDEVTGMPINPREPVYVPREEGRA